MVGKKCLIIYFFLYKNMLANSKIFLFLVNFWFLFFVKVLQINKYQRNFFEDNFTPFTLHTAWHFPEFVFLSCTDTQLFKEVYLSNTTWFSHHKVEESTVTGILHFFYSKYISLFHFKSPPLFNALFFWQNQILV